MSWIAQSLRQNPELALFATLALGHALSRLRLGPVKLNPVIGVLLAGVVIGQIGIDVPAALQSVFFMLFLFAIGYKIGPQFFRGLGRDALPQIGLAVLLCGTALATAYLLSRVFAFNTGAAAGLMAGGMNASAALGTADEAIAKLPVTDAVRHQLSTDAAVAFAVTYLAGLVTAVGTLSKLGPWLMRVDLREECRKLEAELKVEKAGPGVFSADQHFVARSYGVPADLDGTTAADLELAFAPSRIFVERVRTRHGVIDAEPDMVLRAGDAVALTGPRQLLLSLNCPLLRCEIDDQELLDIPSTTVDHVLTRSDLRHRTLSEVGEILSREVPTRGVFVHGVSRVGQPLPVGTNLVLEQGDMLSLLGPTRHVERVAAHLGSVERSSSSTDMVVLAAAIALGGLIGLPSLHIAGVDIGLSLPVGILLGGLLVGWLRSRRPLFGRVPEAALWLLDSLGLTAFLALVGISAGPGFVHGLRTSGVTLLATGVIACAVPNIITILVGRYVLRMHPGLLLGVCAGGGTSPAALAAVLDVAESEVPTLGYGVSYAVGSVLLALTGTLIVILVHSPLR